MIEEVKTFLLAGCNAEEIAAFYGIDLLTASALMTRAATELAT